MKEKRRHPRFDCKIKASYKYFEGPPDESDPKKLKSKNGKGIIRDISRSGFFLVTKKSVTIGHVISINFKAWGKKHVMVGRIVRTGLIMNNPTDEAIKLEKYIKDGDIYIGIELSDLIDFNPYELQE
jgi:hypothetical protein